jgi:hypothetical protein
VRVCDTTIHTHRRKQEAEKKKKEQQKILGKGRQKLSFSLFGSGG